MSLHNPDLYFFLCLLTGFAAFLAIECIQKFCRPKPPVVLPLDGLQLDRPARPTEEMLLLLALLLALDARRALEVQLALAMEDEPRDRARRVGIIQMYLADLTESEARTRRNGKNLGSEKRQSVPWKKLTFAGAPRSASASPSCALH